MAQPPSDVIGDLGELKFRELCRAATLDVAQPIPDRTGKDLIIEWPPLSPSCGMSFDTRPAPLVGIVQVKSIIAAKSRIVISLSAAERLARDLRPAFIVAARVSEDSIVQDMHVIHLRGRLIGHLLKRLRLASKSGKQPNDLKMSISIRSGAPVALRGIDMRRHLEVTIGADMAAYAEAKQHELDHLGFDDRRVLVNLKFSGHTPEDIVDGLIGDIELNASSIEFSERRFDIELPGLSSLPDAPSSMPAIVSIRAAAVPCKIIVRTRTDAEPLSLAAELQSAGLPGTEFIRIRLRTQLVDFVISQRSLKLSLRGAAGEQTWPLAVWSDTFRCMRMVAEAGAQLTLVPSDERPSFTVEGRVVLDEAKVRALRGRENYFADLQAIVQAAGCPGPVGRFEEFARFDSQFVRYALSALRDSDELEALSFTTSSLVLPDEVDGSTIILLSLLRLGDQHIGIAQKSIFDIAKYEGGHHWRSRRLKFLCAKHMVGDVDKAYAAFRLEVERISGITMQIDPGLFADRMLDDEAA